MIEHTCNLIWFYLLTVIIPQMNNFFPLFRKKQSKNEEQIFVKAPESVPEFMKHYG